MPPQRFAVLNVEQILTAFGYKIIVTTNVPCHLWKRWTTIHPQIHKIPVLRRGLYLHTDIRICFVAYKDHEQEEAGDTTIHTFIEEPWPVCQTRWFMFRGTIDGIESPSTSGLFTKHRPGQIIVGPTYCKHRSAHAFTYADAHAGAGHTDNWHWEHCDVQQSQRSDYGYFIERVLGYFDLPTLSGKHITKAILYFKFQRGILARFTGVKNYDWDVLLRGNNPYNLATLPDYHFVENWQPALEGTLIASTYVADCIDYEWHEFDVLGHVHPPAFPFSFVSRKDQDFQPPPNNTLEPCDFYTERILPGDTDRAKLLVQYTV